MMFKIGLLVLNFMILAVIITLLVSFKEKLSEILKQGKEQNKLKTLSLYISVLLYIIVANVGVISNVVMDVSEEIEIVTIGDNKASPNFVEIIEYGDSIYNTFEKTKEFYKQQIKEKKTKKITDNRILLKDKTAMELIEKRDNSEADWENYVETSRELYNYLPYNENIIITHRNILQDYAIECYSHKVYNEAIFKEAYETNLALLELQDGSYCESEAYYKIGQCFEYLSLMAKERELEQKEYRYTLISGIFFELSLDCNDYQESQFYGYSYFQCATLLDRLVRNYDVYDVDLCNKAIEYYQIAITQLPINSNNRKTCISSLEELQDYKAFQERTK